MKITHNKVGQNLNLTDTGRAAKTDKPNDAKIKDGKPSLLDVTANSSDATKVDLSPRAQEMKKVKDIANSKPDIDEAKVAKYQKLIDAGKYEVDAEGLADKMVDEHIMFS